MVQIKIKKNRLKIKIKTVNIKEFKLKDKE